MAEGNPEMGQSSASFEISELPRDILVSPADVLAAFRRALQSDVPREAALVCTRELGDSYALSSSEIRYLRILGQPLD